MIACAPHMLPISTHIQHHPSLEVVSVLVKQQQLCIIAVYSASSFERPLCIKMLYKLEKLLGYDSISCEFPQNMVIQNSFI